MREISPRFLHVAGGFRGRAIEWCQTNSTTADPCCHSNEIWDKIGNNAAACAGDITEIHVGFSGLGYWMMSDKFHHDQSRLPHGNEIWDKIYYNSICIGNISKIKTWKNSDNKTANINVKNSRFNTSVTMTPIKHRKRQKFVYCIFACNNFLSEDDDIVMMLWNFCMRKYHKRIFAVFNV